MIYIKLELISMKKFDKGLGIWQILTSEIITDIIASSGFDFTILDLEHGLHDPQSVQNCIFSAKKSGINLIARIPSLAYPYVVQIIDTGIDGILFPHIETESQLKEAINLTYMSPIGGKSFSPFVPRFDYGEIKSSLKSNPMLGILIESEKALKNSPLLLSNPLVDFVYFGAYDLSVEIGDPGNIFSKHIVDELILLTQYAKENNKKIMSLYRNDTELKKLLKIGVHYPIAGVDTLNLKLILNKLFQSYKKIIS
tara:strand:- start:910 stop:1671 length:762 start_codon:yes stop_codon:yes gene_type:complete